MTQTLEAKPDNSVAGAGAFQAERIDHWNDVALQWKGSTGLGHNYHSQLSRIYKLQIPPGSRVLEIGCGAGDLLASLQPSVGVGIDFSPEMIDLAQGRHPRLRFLCRDACELDLDESFDFIIMSDLINDLWDVQAVIEQFRNVATPETRILINSYSRLWAAPLSWAERLGLSRPKLTQNWLTLEDIQNLLHLSGFEVTRHWQEVLSPISVPLVSTFANRVLAKLPGFRTFALTNFLAARSTAPRVQDAALPRVSVIVPARNEAGNIAAIFDRVPEMGAGTELIFIEGHSTDNTYETIDQAIAEHPERCCQLHRQAGKGKGDAVRLGFAQATGDILMILDADLTVAPEDLPRFYETLRSGRGEFINGVRLVYPMENEAMRFANLIGNKFFSLAFSWLLGQPIKDTLCGTKVLWRRDYELIAANRHYFGDFDPFGDFDLLFGAAKLNLRIVDLPIRYRSRTYGTTNIQRWKHGWMLLKMVAFAATRIKFV
jgi:ubiquinone/menaquinone biosynthesis C-methylase UbiE